MDEITNILDELERRDEAGVLATLVHVDGSSYRRAGARMLVTRGRCVGSISAGCLEAEICDKAFEWTANGAVLKTFETGSAQDDVWGWGSGCRGVLSVLLEPAREQIPFLQMLMKYTDGRDAVAVATVFRTSDADRLKLGTKVFLAQGQEPEEGVAALLFERFAEDGARIQTVQVKADALAAQVFIEAIRPRVQLLVFGDGDGPEAVTRLALPLGWNVVRIGNEVAADEFKQERVRWVTLADWQDGETGALDAQTAAVVMTHRFLLDCDLVRSLLDQDAAYVGVMGSRRRAMRLTREFAGFSQAQLSRLHCPIGLDLGAETPEEIALAVTAEVLAALRRSAGISLRSERAARRSGRYPSIVMTPELERTRA